jgi:alkylated DNA repair dioxygenase AlkB
MNPIDPVVHELLLDPDGARKWKFTGKMKQGLDNTLAARMWWVNSNTKISTFLTDRCVDTSNRPPPGLHVFSPLAPPEELARVVCELERLYQEESEHHTLTYSDHIPVGNTKSIHFLFTGSDPYEPQLSLSQVIATLIPRAPATANLIQTFAEATQKLLGIPEEALESACIFQLLKYTPNSGLATHIDNVSRMGDSAGPILSMSLGSCGVKHMDLFPVLDHNSQGKTPLRITTPVGSVIFMDGIARMNWSHGIPEGDPSVRWSIMFKLKQVSSTQVGFSEILKTPVFASEIHTGCMVDRPQASQEQSELLTQLSELDAKLAAFEKRQTSTRQQDETLLLALLAEMLKAS